MNKSTGIHLSREKKEKMRQNASEERQNVATKCRKSRTQPPRDETPECRHPKRKGRYNLLTDDLCANLLELQGPMP